MINSDKLYNLLPFVFKLMNLSKSISLKPDGIKSGAFSFSSMVAKGKISVIVSLWKNLPKNEVMPSSPVSE